MGINCLLSYSKIQKREGAKLRRKKDPFTIKLFCRMQQGACEMDIYLFLFFLLKRFILILVSSQIITLKFSFTAIFVNMAP